MKNYENKKILPFTISGHCIELEYNDEKLMGKLLANGCKEFIEGHFSDIADKISEDWTSDIIEIGNETIKWTIVVFVVQSEWSDSEWRDSEINGVFNSYESAKELFEEIIKTDQNENDIHKSVVESQSRGEDTDYIIDKSENNYSIFEDGYYDNYHFNVSIHKKALNKK